MEINYTIRCPFNHLADTHIHELQKQIAEANAPTRLVGTPYAALSVAYLHVMSKPSAVFAWLVSQLASSTVLSY